MHDDRRSEAADDLLARLRAGDETAFATLVDELNGPLLALARTFTPSLALAEDIVQETWLAAIRGLSRFEGRSALRTWIYGILVRRARTLAAREARQRAGEARTAGDPGEAWRFGSGRRGLWEEAPVPWALDDPASIHEGEETLKVVSAALDGLPQRQRQVVHLRDVEGLEAHDVCNILRLSETNQRVLLHRGRAAIRRALDRHLRAGSRLRSLGLAVAMALSMVGGGP